MRQKEIEKQKKMLDGTYNPEEEEVDEPDPETAKLLEDQISIYEEIGR